MTERAEARTGVVPHKATCEETRKEKEVEALDRRIRSLERSPRPEGARSAGGIATGWEDAGDPGAPLLLARGGVHEWYVEAPEEAAGSPAPPLCLLAHLAGRALDAGPGHALWIGKRCWPHPRTLIRAGGADPAPLRRSVFVDPPLGAEEERGGEPGGSRGKASPRIGTRIWAIDVALRNPATAVVVADGTGLDMAASRRLQLAAETGGGAIGLIARPASDRGAISAATTRWSVRPVPTAGRRPRWRITLERWKGGAGGVGDPGRRRVGHAWEVVWDDDAGTLLPAIAREIREAPETREAPA